MSNYSFDPSSITVKAIEEVLQHEGGFVNDPDDTGGMTICGVSRNNNEDWKGWEYVDQYLSAHMDPKAMHEDKAIMNFVQDFYTQRYLQNVPAYLNASPLAIMMFSADVLCGHKQAVKFLQYSINDSVKSKGGESVIVADGVSGDKTATAFITLDLLPPQGELVRHFYVLILAFFIGLADRKPTNVKYLKGWYNRFTDLFDKLNNPGYLYLLENPLQGSRGDKS